MALKYWCSVELPLEEIRSTKEGALYALETPLRLSLRGLTFLWQLHFDRSVRRWEVTSLPPDWSSEESEAIKVGFRLDETKFSGEYDRSQTPFKLFRGSYYGKAYNSGEAKATVVFAVAIAPDELEPLGWLAKREKDLFGDPTAVSPLLSRLWEGSQRTGLVVVRCRGGAEVRASHDVLCAESEFFRGLFRFNGHKGDEEEDEEGGGERCRVDFSDYDEATVRLVLEQAHKGTVAVGAGSLSVAAMGELLSLAEQVATPAHRLFHAVVEKELAGRRLERCEVGPAVALAGLHKLHLLRNLLLTRLCAEAPNFALDAQLKCSVREEDWVEVLRISGATQLEL